jgi:endonuclease YncB( thermonuclease family)
MPFFTQDMKQIGYFCLFPLILLVSCTGSRSHRLLDEPVTGRVVKVIDGDTYDLLLGDMTTLRIRMEGIDAPEKGMPFSRVSKNYLSQLCEGQTLKVCITEDDQHGRKVGFSYLADGRELGREMLKAGLAWHFKRYNDDPSLTALEDSARAANIGLWGERPYILPPWTVRKLNRQGYKTQDIYKAQREHLRGQHTAGCPDSHLCGIINEEKYE